MDRENEGIEFGDSCRRLPYRIWDVVELEIQEDLQVHLALYLSQRGEPMSEVELKSELVDSDVRSRSLDQRSCFC